MARGWHYAKLSLSNAPRLSFYDLLLLLFLTFSALVANPVYFVIPVPFSSSFFVCLRFFFALIGAW